MILFQCPLCCQQVIAYVAEIQIYVSMQIQHIQNTDRENKNILLQIKNGAKNHKTKKHGRKIMQKRTKNTASSKITT